MKHYRIIKHEKLDEDLKHVSGYCYPVAAKYVMYVNTRATLVHGTVEVEGKRIKHAWAETANRVFDSFTKTLVPHEAYYEVLKPTIDRKYNHIDATIQLLKHQHWGPWE